MRPSLARGDVWSNCADKTLLKRHRNLDLILHRQTPTGFHVAAAGLNGWVVGLTERSTWAAGTNH